MDRQGDRRPPFVLMGERSQYNHVLGPFQNISNVSRTPDADVL